MQYRFNMTYRQEDFIGFMGAYVARTTYLKKMGRLTRIFTRFAGGLMVIAGAANIVLSIYAFSSSGESMPIGYWVTPVVIILVGLLIFYSKDSTLSGKVLWKKYDKKGAPISFLFAPDGFKEHDRGGDSRYDYSVITDIYEDEGHYYLFTSPSTAHILVKEGVSRSLEGFNAFIEEKTGRKVMTV